MYFPRTLVLAACGLASVTAVDNIYDVAAGNDDFSTLITATDAAGLKDDVNDPEGAMTVFAPTNAAFDKLPDGLVTKLLKPDWKPQLVDLLKYHVLDSVVVAVEVTDKMTTPALNGEELSFAVGETVVVSKGDGTVTMPDIVASNGVIHGIDAVLTPTSITSNVVEIASADTDTFSTLVAAVTAADLATTLSGPGPFTVLAPTNDAFAALPAGTVETLLKPENKDQLTGILKLHVISGNIPSSAVTTSTVTTLGGDIEAKVGDDGVFFNDAKVIKADVLANNGIIHVLNKVLLPPSDDATTKATAAPGATTKATAAPGATTKATTAATTTPGDESAASRMTFLSALALTVGVALML